jgi:hypothetical protein
LELPCIRDDAVGDVLSRELRHDSAPLLLVRMALLEPLSRDERQVALGGLAVRRHLDDLIPGERRLVLELCGEDFRQPLRHLLVPLDQRRVHALEVRRALAARRETAASRPWP